MNFRKFYRWMIEFEPLDAERAQHTLKRILSILSVENKKEKKK